MKTKIMTDEGRFVVVLKAKEKAEREEERAAMMKTLAGACETLIDTIRNFLARLLREIRKPFLEVCKLLDTAIEDLGGETK